VTEAWAFCYSGSSASPDSSERIEAKVDRLLAERGISVGEFERELPYKFRRTR
jgi:hypothetical protein